MVWWYNIYTGDKYENIRFNMFGKCNTIYKCCYVDCMDLLFYMTLSFEDLDLYIDITKSGEYVLTIKAVSNKLIDIGKII